MDKETEKIIYDCILFAEVMKDTIEGLLTKLLKFRNNHSDTSQKEVKSDDES